MKENARMSTAGMAKIPALWRFRTYYNPWVYSAIILTMDCYYVPTKNSHLQ